MISFPFAEKAKLNEVCVSRVVKISESNIQRKRKNEKGGNKGEWKEITERR